MTLLKSFTGANEGFNGRWPSITGKVFFVAPTSSYTVNGVTYTASDSNGGEHYSLAMATIDAANNRCTASQGDVIYLLPGTHNTVGANDESIALDTAGVHLMGAHRGGGNFLRKNEVTIGPVTGNQAVNVTAADVEISHINFEPVAADTAIDFTADADQLHIHDCSFDMFTPAPTTAVIGIEALAGADQVVIERCSFVSDGDQGNAIAVVGCDSTIIQNCLFWVHSGTWPSVILSGAGSTALLVRRNDFICSGASVMTAGITGATVADSYAQYTDNYFSDSVGTAIDAHGANDGNLTNNFQAGLGSTDGGILVAAST